MAERCPYTGGPALFHSEGLAGPGERDGAGDGDGDEKDDKERAEPTPETCGEESPAAAWAVGSDRRSGVWGHVNPNCMLFPSFTPQKTQVLTQLLNAICFVKHGTAFLPAGRCCLLSPSALLEVKLCPPHLPGTWPSSLPSAPAPMTISSAKAL